MAKLSLRATEVLLSEVETLGGTKHVSIAQLYDIAIKDPELKKLSIAELADIVISYNRFRCLSKGRE